MSETHINVRTKSPFREDECQALADNVLTRIGDKWTVKVVLALSQGPMRYSQIFKLVASISQRMLTLTLKNLERDGLVSRTVYPTNPPRVDYALTEQGQTLTAPLNALFTWSYTNSPAIEAARRAFDERQRNAEVF